MTRETRTVPLRVIDGGGEDGPCAANGHPLPSAPRKGFRFSVWHGEHHWTNWSIHAANGRSFVAYSDGVSTRHPNPSWRLWLAERVSEGRVVVGDWGQPPVLLGPRLLPSR